MSKPGCSFLLTADQRYPFTTATAATLPDVWIAVHTSRLAGLLEGCARRRADTMRKALVIPER